MIFNHGVLKSDRPQICQQPFSRWQEPTRHRFRGVVEKADGKDIPQ